MPGLNAHVTLHKDDARTLVQAPALYLQGICFTNGKAGLQVSLYHPHPLSISTSLCLYLKINNIIKRQILFMYTKRGLEM